MAIKVCGCLIVTSYLASIISGAFMTGSYKSIPTNSTSAEKAAAFAVMRYNQLSNDANFYKKLHIVSAESQVVAGINYRVEVKMGRTSCRKNEVSVSGNGPSCDVANSDVSQVNTCTFVVFQSLPPPELSLTCFSCVPQ